MKHEMTDPGNSHQRMPCFSNAQAWPGGSTAPEHSKFTILGLLMVFDLLSGNSTKFICHPESL
jgi:hypothetical protein